MLRHGGRRSYQKTLYGLATADRGRTAASRRRYASVAEGLRPGQQLHGFTLQDIKHVPELHLTAFKLEHDKTGAQYLHVDRDDKNNVFAVNFKTNPIDRTGLPHILEHVTLCGSEKYPVRDPFFKMMPRSLANFMNAFTSSDYTSYPFATTNAKDYRNLSEVYLDATFRPLLKRTDFLQEGWRLGPEDPRAKATADNVIFKGVVYNEMKGQMSDASYLFYVRFREHLFPSLENSGGDPEKMTDLSYESLVKFSRQNYHPSNAKLFSYGNFPLAPRLETADGVLSKFDKRQATQEVKPPIDLSQGPLHFKTVGPLDSMQPTDRQVKASITWLGCEPADIVESFAISIMSSLLMNGYGSPLYQGLIESGLGTNFSPNTGYDSAAKVGTLTIGLDGMSAEDASSLKDRIQTTLREKAHEAFAPHKIEGYMHQLELALKHKTAGFGMSLLEKTVPSWFNGVDPFKSLTWNEVVDSFKQRLQQEGYLYSLVEKYLLNDKCMSFMMAPQETYNADLIAREELRRQSILQELVFDSSNPEAALLKLGQQELKLLNEQETAQSSNIETLPTLRVSDIPRTTESKPRYHASIGKVDTLWRETSTNGITYFSAKHVLRNVADELRLLFPLFSESLMRLGTKHKSVGDIEAEILLRTGGISISPFASPDPHEDDLVHEGFSLDGYALDHNVPAMFDLMRSVLLEVDFDSPTAKKAIQELLESKTSGALDGVAESGNSFAVTSAASALSRRGILQDQLSGLTQIEATAQMLEQSRADPASLETVIDKLKKIQSIAISNTADLSLRVVCEPTAVSVNTRHIESFLSQLPSSPLPLSSIVGSNTFLSRRAFFDLPFQVSYAGTCLKTVPYSSPDKAPLMILGQLLTHNFMHPEIREKGGAYGGSASASPISSLFTMSSYRDPNPRNTLSVFERAGSYARDKAWTSRELEESKLGLFQHIDAPTSVSGDGSKEFVFGITEEMEQRTRERLLDTTKDDIQRVAQQYLVDLPADQRSICLLGEQKEWIGQDPKPWQVRHLRMAADDADDADEGVSV
ncbi:Mitochondrial presequence protease [Cyphellophora attinorum]|uniref:Presequence protease, mitochondrial n=1 Tax=Cyphellophora attinorum TaxID=1664694 RepID=A0A0N1HB24_9EURO|nr:Mitochondrial presequence protease [Phialophora attinorum]KPI45555.1 Mitochondrial presequence protease [Phialophora attinorum]